MNFNVFVTPDFKRDAKRLTKKYKSLKTELLALVASLEIAPTQGTAIGNDCYKIRLAIKSKSKGKSGGARVITCVKLVGSTVFLLTLYDKSEQENINNKELLELIKNLQ
jgi:hypothetical protein